MQKEFTAYLSLGSNLKDRLAYLNTAVNLIHQKSGTIENISAVYENPAWGFEGLDFYNICLSLKTNLPPLDLLNSLKKIEKKIGRKEKTTHSYQNRCIDIDILSYENTSLNTSELKLPHPRALDRNFVLIPLADVCNPELKVLNEKTLKNNLENCPDKNPLKKVNYKITLMD